MEYGMCANIPIKLKNICLICGTFIQNSCFSTVFKYATQNGILKIPCFRCTVWSISRQNWYL